MKDLPSPCVSICKENPLTGYCDGCYRTRKEISDWPYLNEKEKKDLLNVPRSRRGVKRKINRRRGVKTN